MTARRLKKERGRRGDEGEDEEEEGEEGGYREGGGVEKGEVGCWVWGRGEGGALMPALDIFLHGELSDRRHL